VYAEIAAAYASSSECLTLSSPEITSGYMQVGFEYTEKRRVKKAYRGSVNKCGLERGSASVE